LGDGLMQLSLAHTVGTAVVRAYAREDAVKQRQILCARSEFVLSELGEDAIDRFVRHRLPGRREPMSLTSESPCSLTSKVLALLSTQVVPCQVGDQLDANRVGRCERRW
jgi:hypothetical protein